jgi:hypothetical protein
MLNDKHLVIHPSQRPETTAAIQRMYCTVVASVDKCRRALAPVDIEFTKDFASYRFDPSGSYVAEQLIQEG